MYGHNNYDHKAIGNHVPYPHISGNIPVSNHLSTFQVARRDSAHNIQPYNYDQYSASVSAPTLRPSMPSSSDSGRFSSFTNTSDTNPDSSWHASQSLVSQHPQSWNQVFPVQYTHNPSSSYNYAIPSGPQTSVPVREQSWSVQYSAPQPLASTTSGSFPSPTHTHLHTPNYPPTLPPGYNSMSGTMAGHVGLNMGVGVGMGVNLQGPNIVPQQHGALNIPPHLQTIHLQQLQQMQQMQQLQLQQMQMLANAYPNSAVYVNHNGVPVSVFPTPIDAHGHYSLSVNSLGNPGLTQISETPIDPAAVVVASREERLQKRNDKGSNPYWKAKACSFWQHSHCKKLAEECSFRHTATIRFDALHIRNTDEFRTLLLSVELGTVSASAFWSGVLALLARVFTVAGETTPIYDHVTQLYGFLHGRRRAAGKSRKLFFTVEDICRICNVSSPIALFANSAVGVLRTLLLAPSELDMHTHPAYVYAGTTNNKLERLLAVICGHVLLLLLSNAVVVHGNEPLTAAKLQYEALYAVDSHVMSNAAQKAGASKDGDGMGVGLGSGMDSGVGTDVGTGKIMGGNNGVPMPTQPMFYTNTFDTLSSHPHTNTLLLSAPAAASTSAATPASTSSLPLPPDAVEREKAVGDQHDSERGEKEKDNRDRDKSEKEKTEKDKHRRGGGREIPAWLASLDLLARIATPPNSRKNDETAVDEEKIVTFFCDSSHNESLLYLQPGSTFVLHGGGNSAHSLPNGSPLPPQSPRSGAQAEGGRGSGRGRGGNGGRGARRGNTIITSTSTSTSSSASSSTSTSVSTSASTSTSTSASTTPTSTTNARINGATAAKSTSNSSSSGGGNANSNGNGNGTGSSNASGLSRKGLARALQEASASTAVLRMGICVALPVPSASSSATPSTTPSAVPSAVPSPCAANNGSHGSINASLNGATNANLNPKITPKVSTCTDVPAHSIITGAGTGNAHTANANTTTSSNANINAQPNNRSTGAVSAARGSATVQTSRTTNTDANTSGCGKGRSGDTTASSPPSDTVSRSPPSKASVISTASTVATPTPASPVPSTGTVACTTGTTAPMPNKGEAAAVPSATVAPAPRSLTRSPALPAGSVSGVSNLHAHSTTRGACASSIAPSPLTITTSSTSTSTSTSAAASSSSTPLAAASASSHSSPSLPTSPSPAFHLASPLPSPLPSLPTHTQASSRTLSYAPASSQSHPSMHVTADICAASEAVEIPADVVVATHEEVNTTNMAGLSTALKNVDTIVKVCAASTSTSTGTVKCADASVPHGNHLPAPAEMVVGVATDTGVDVGAAVGGAGEAAAAIGEDAIAEAAACDGVDEDGMCEGFVCVERMCGEDARVEHAPTEIADTASSPSNSLPTCLSITSSNNDPISSNPTTIPDTNAATAWTNTQDSSCGDHETILAASDGVPPMSVWNDGSLSKGDVDAQSSDEYRVALAKAADSPTTSVSVRNGISGEAAISASTDIRADTVDVSAVADVDADAGSSTDTEACADAAGSDVSTTGTAAAKNVIVATRISAHAAHGLDSEAGTTHAAIAATVMVATVANDTVGTDTSLISADTAEVMYTALVDSKTDDEKTDDEKDDDDVVADKAVCDVYGRVGSDGVCSGDALVATLCRSVSTASTHTTRATHTTTPLTVPVALTLSSQHAAKHATVSLAGHSLSASALHDSPTAGPLPTADPTAGSAHTCHILDGQSRSSSVCTSRPGSGHARATATASTADVSTSTSTTAAPTALRPQWGTKPCAYYTHGHCRKAPGSCPFAHSPLLLGICNTAHTTFMQNPLFPYILTGKLPLPVAPGQGVALLALALARALPLMTVMPCNSQHVHPEKEDTQKQRNSLSHGGGPSKSRPSSAGGIASASNTTSTWSSTSTSTCASTSAETDATDAQVSAHLPTANTHTSSASAPLSFSTPSALDPLRAPSTSTSTSAISCTACLAELHATSTRMLALLEQLGQSTLDALQRASNTDDLPPVSAAQRQAHLQTLALPVTGHPDLVWLGGFAVKPKYDSNCGFYFIDPDAVYYIASDVVGEITVDAARAAGGVVYGSQPATLAAVASAPVPLVRVRDVREWATFACICARDGVDVGERTGDGCVDAGGDGIPNNITNADDSANNTSTSTSKATAALAPSPTLSLPRATGLLLFTSAGPALDSELPYTHCRGCALRPLGSSALAALLSVSTQKMAVHSVSKTRLSSDSIISGQVCGSLGNMATQVDAAVDGGSASTGEAASMSTGNDGSGVLESVHVALPQQRPATHTQTEEFRLPPTHHHSHPTQYNTPPHNSLEIDVWAPHPLSPRCLLLCTCTAPAAATLPFASLVHLSRALAADHGLRGTLSADCGLRSALSLCGTPLVELLGDARVHQWLREHLGVEVGAMSGVLSSGRHGGGMGGVRVDKDSMMIFREEGNGYGSRRGSVCVSGYGSRRGSCGGSGSGYVHSNSGGPGYLSEGARNSDLDIGTSMGMGMSSLQVSVHPYNASTHMHPHNTHHAAPSMGTTPMHTHMGVPVHSHSHVSVSVPLRTPTPPLCLSATQSAHIHHLAPPLPSHGSNTPIPLSLAHIPSAHMPSSVKRMSFSSPSATFPLPNSACGAVSAATAAPTPLSLPLSAPAHTPNMQTYLQLPSQAHTPLSLPLDAHTPLGGALAHTLTHTPFSLPASAATMMSGHSGEGHCGVGVGLDTSVGAGGDVFGNGVFMNASNASMCGSNRDAGRVSGSRSGSGVDMMHRTPTCTPSPSPPHSNTLAGPSFSLSAVASASPTVSSHPHPPLPLPLPLPLPPSAHSRPSPHDTPLSQALRPPTPSPHSHPSTHSHSHSQSHAFAHTHAHASGLPPALPPASSPHTPHALHAQAHTPMDNGKSTACLSLPSPLQLPLQPQPQQLSAHEACPLPPTPVTNTHTDALVLSFLDSNGKNLFPTYPESQSGKMDMIVSEAPLGNHGTPNFSSENANTQQDFGISAKDSILGIQNAKFRKSAQYCLSVPAAYRVIGDYNHNSDIHIATDANGGHNGIGSGGGGGVVCAAGNGNGEGVCDAHIDTDAGAGMGELPTFDIATPHHTHAQDQQRQYQPQQQQSHHQAAYNQHQHASAHTTPTRPAYTHSTHATPNWSVSPSTTHTQASASTLQAAQGNGAGVVMAVQTAPRTGSGINHGMQASQGSGSSNGMQTQSAFGTGSGGSVHQQHYYVNQGGYRVPNVQQQHDQHQYQHQQHQHLQYHHTLPQQQPPLQQYQHYYQQQHSYPSHSTYNNNVAYHSHTTNNSLAYQSSTNSAGYSSSASHVSPPSSIPHQQQQQQQYYQPQQHVQVRAHAQPQMYGHSSSLHSTHLPHPHTTHSYAHHTNTNTGTNTTLNTTPTRVKPDADVSHPVSPQDIATDASTDVNAHANEYTDVDAETEDGLYLTGRRLLEPTAGFSSARDDILAFEALSQSTEDEQTRSVRIRANGSLSGFVGGTGIPDKFGRDGLAYPRTPTHTHFHARSHTYTPMSAQTHAHTPLSAQTNIPDSACASIAVSAGASMMGGYGADASLHGDVYAPLALSTSTSVGGHASSGGAGMASSSANGHGNAGAGGVRGGDNVPVASYHPLHSHTHTHSHTPLSSASAHAPSHLPAHTHSGAPSLAPTTVLSSLSTTAPTSLFAASAATSSASASRDVRLRADGADAWGMAWSSPALAGKAFSHLTMQLPAHTQPQIHAHQHADGTGSANSSSSGGDVKFNAAGALPLSLLTAPDVHAPAPIYTHFAHISTPSPANTAAHAAPRTLRSDRLSQTSLISLASHVSLASRTSQHSQQSHGSTTGPALTAHASTNPAQQPTPLPPEYFSSGFPTIQTFPDQHGPQNQNGLMHGSAAMVAQSFAWDMGGVDLSRRY